MAGRKLGKVPSKNRGRVDTAAAKPRALVSTVDRVPPHLKPYIVAQPQDLYTFIDHATWRFIMRLSQAFYAKTAHSKYLDGLAETGIATERIPSIDEMDACLQKFGWGAVPISGFIPPSAFMEMLSLKILPIAADIRKLENLDYTPSPDIVHEAAGHAPILADSDYAEFMSHCGEIARKCIIAKHDIDIYEAVRRLSDLKEDPHSTAQEISEAEAHLKQVGQSAPFVSEIAQFARFIWWTVEYGLVGSLKHPKIYGAGLLSSVSEGYHCLSDKIKKIPLSLDCINYGYDITEPQPQLFVTPDFHHMLNVLEEFRGTLAYRRGGKYALDKAVEAAHTTTIELDSGLQIAGVMTKYRVDSAGDPYYLQFTGPTQLAFHDEEIKGQGIDYHKEGFSTPVGPLKATGRSPHELTSTELQKLGWKIGLPLTLEFISGVVVKGICENLISRGTRPVIMVFSNCTVACKGEVLFRAEWGHFDMVCGGRVVAAYGGAADRPRYLLDHQRYKPRTPVKNLTPQNQDLADIFLELRKLRETSPKDVKSIEAKLEALWQRLNEQYPDEWLSRLEILEIEQNMGLNATRSRKIREQLKHIEKTSPQIQELIRRGLELLKPL